MAPITCTVCKSVVKIVQNYILDGMTQKSIVNTLTNLCVGLNIQAEEVCRGIIELNAVGFLMIMMISLQKKLTRYRSFSPSPSTSLTTRRV